MLLSKDETKKDKAAIWSVAEEFPVTKCHSRLLGKEWVTCMSSAGTQKGEININTENQVENAKNDKSTKIF